MATGESSLQPRVTIRASRYNRAAAGTLREVRRLANMNQTEFAALLAAKLGADLSQQAYSDWETGVRSVPGGALMAAFDLAGEYELAIGDLVGRQLGPRIVQPARRVAQQLEAAIAALDPDEQADAVRLIAAQRRFRR